MKRLRYTLSFAIIALLQPLIFMTCKNSPEPIPAFDPNMCTQYSCPTHQDKTSTKLDRCPQCGVLMMKNNFKLNFDTPKTRLVCDSFSCYQTNLMYINPIITEGFQSKEEQGRSKNETINKIIPKSKSNALK